MKYFLFGLFLFSISLLFVGTKVYAISFTISNPVINSDDSIELDASISGLISSSCSTAGCYLQAELKILDESKGYFGFTYNNSGDFVDYSSTFSSTDDIKSKLFNFVPSSGAWSGKLKAKNNFESPNYIGPGQYTLRFKRFSGNSISATNGDSNALALNLTLATPTPVPTVQPTPSPSPTASPTPKSTATPKAIVIPSPSPAKVGSSTSGVLGADDSASDSSNFPTQDSTPPSSSILPSAESKDLGSNNLLIIFFVLGGSLLATGVGYIAYDRLMKEKIL